MSMNPSETPNAERLPTSLSDAAAGAQPKTVSLVIPVYNEGGAIEQNLPAILDSLPHDEQVIFRVLLVDDGSTDGTAAWIGEFCRGHDHVELLCLSRNFGKEAAILAGLSHAAGDAIIVMDSDLQHPPGLIAQMLVLWRRGMDVVEACKSSRGSEPAVSRMLAGGFYRVFRLMTGMDIENHSDYKLLDRKVVDAYCALPERKRFFRGLIAWMGFPTARLSFDVPERRHGSSGWSFLKLLRLSVTALTSFSSALLHLITVLGVLSFVLSLVIGGIALYDKYTGQAVSGFTTVILLILLIGSFIMVGLGLVGMYIEQIFDEIKQRPVYKLDARKSRLRR